MKNKMPKGLSKKFSKIKLLLLDFDGTLTDNKVYTSQDGTELVKCDRGDGLGLEMLRKKTDVEIMIISKEKNPVVNARAKKLNIPVIQGTDKKIKEYEKEVKKRKLKDEQVCFVGNDINDIECIQKAGMGIAVADAYEPAKKVADYITLKNGGHGAVREVCDLIIKSKSK
jgi:YrbI family 3-deoxy-D-manno-octulosonate 8-phosphate phosphatase